MPKNPHPSGRPIRKEEKKARMIWWNYPAETYATPRLRPKVLPPVSADAIGYLRTQNLEGVEDCKQPVGFVHFK